MPARTVRVRRLQDGHFEFLEPVRITASEFEVIVNEPAPEAPTRPPHKSRLPASWDMGFKGSFRRDAIYDDLI